MTAFSRGCLVEATPIAESLQPGAVLRDQREGRMPSRVVTRRGRSSMSPHREQHAGPAEERSAASYARSAASCSLRNRLGGADLLPHTDGTVCGCSKGVRVVGRLVAIASASVRCRDSREHRSPGMSGRGGDQLWTNPALRHDGGTGSSCAWDTRLEVRRRRSCGLTFCRQCAAL